MTVVFRFLAMALMCANVYAEAAIALTGPPEAIGEKWGRINATVIQTDMQKSYVKPAAEKGFSEEALVERGRGFVEICAEIAPHWLDEAKAIAKAARVNPDLYTAYIGTVYRRLWAGDECTSYAVSPDYTEENAVFFHKNRDNVAKPQAGCVIASDVPGVNTFITVTDASVLACMMMVNDKGLAGSADTGGTVGAGTPKYSGLMNTFVLRHIAERAASCDDALAIVREFVDKGYYAGGGGTGTHWLFVDKQGRILEVSNNADDVAFQFHDEKVYFSARAGSNAASTLQDAKVPIGFHTFHNVSRDPSMCFDSTISGMTVEISRTHPEHLTCAWLTFPAKGLAFPLFMGCRNTPLPLVNGEVYELCKEIDDAAETWETLERSTHLNKQLVEARVTSLLQRREAAQAGALLDEWGLKTTDAQVSVLRLYRRSK